MTASPNAYKLIKSFEGCKLEAYKDPAGIWTIGWGSTLLRSGKRVKPGDKVTQHQADSMLEWEVHLKEVGVTNLIFPYKVNQNQFDALVSFSFNAGIGALAGSTLLRKLKANVNDPSIEQEFLKWNKVTVNGKLVVLDGLTRRRKAESLLYFAPIKELA